VLIFLDCWRSGWERGVVMNLMNVWLLNGHVSYWFGLQGTLVTLLHTIRQESAFRNVSVRIGQAILGFSH
jgi:hypothetical protein